MYTKWGQKFRLDHKTSPNKARNISKTNFASLQLEKKGTEVNYGCQKMFHRESNLTWRTRNEAGLRIFIENGGMSLVINSGRRHPRVLPPSCPLQHFSGNDRHKIVLRRIGEDIGNSCRKLGENEGHSSTRLVSQRVGRYGTFDRRAPRLSQRLGVLGRYFNIDWVTEAVDCMRIWFRTRDNEGTFANAHHVSDLGNLCAFISQLQGDNEVWRRFKNWAIPLLFSDWSYV